MQEDKAQKDYRKKIKLNTTKKKSKAFLNPKSSLKSD